MWRVGCIDETNWNLIELLPEVYDTYEEARLAVSERQRLTARTHYVIPPIP